MTTELVHRPEFTDEQTDLIKRTVAAGTTNDELKLFLYQCSRTGLDPLAKQIYCIVRGQGDRRKATIQTGIDGYRLIADRTGRYAGNDDAVIDEDEKGAPVKASVTVWKLVGGQRCPFTASARFAQYRPEKRGNYPDMWDKMPHVMISKVAEALALRKAFPADLSGLYTEEEMQQGGNGPEMKVAPKVESTPAPVTSSGNEPPTAHGDLVQRIKAKAPNHPKVNQLSAMSPRQLQALAASVGIDLEGSLSAGQSAEGTDPSLTTNAPPPKPEGGESGVRGSAPDSPSEGLSGFTGFWDLLIAQAGTTTEKTTARAWAEGLATDKTLDCIDPKSNLGHKIRDFLRALETENQKGSAA